MGTDFFIYMKSELSLLLIIFALLIIKVWDGIQDNKVLLMLANILLLINFLFGLVLNFDGQLFNGMFYTNEIISTEKSILNLGMLVVSLTGYGWLKVHKHLLEFYVLILSTLLGMFYMISSGNLLMFYLGLELSSIPLAALVNFDMERRTSSEGAMKMILSSAFSSAIMLFGISMLYGTTGTLSMAELPALLSGGYLQILSLVFVFTGFAFKLSSVPFHLWTADVYEGAPVTVTAFMSVISKAAMVFVFMSVLAPLFVNMQGIWYGILFLSIVLSITVGNLFAMRQSSMKRFLAFSSIAQVGYILLGLSSGNEMGATSTLYFLVVYLFSNLAVLGVVSIVSSETGKENISDYKAFYKNNKALSWVIAIALFSLAGIPPTAGFFGKMFLVTAGASKGNYILVTLAALNMVVSLYYYLRVVKAIFIEENETPMEQVKINGSAAIGLIICMIGVVMTGFASALYDYFNSLFL